MRVANSPGKGECVRMGFFNFGRVVHGVTCVMADDIVLVSRVVLQRGT